MKNIKQEFPIFYKPEENKPLVYLDSGASSQKPRKVIESLTHTYSKIYSNIHRGIHDLSMRSSDAVETARSDIARFVGANDSSEIVFTSGATQGINMIAYGIAHTVNPGDNVLVSIADHHSNILPWMRLCQQQQAELRYVNVLPDGSFDHADFAQKIDNKTAIVAMPHASNVLGTIFPVLEIAIKAHTNGALFVVDGCQGLPHLKFDVKAMKCDFYVASAHKFYGPSGVGFIYGTTESFKKMIPMNLGGGIVDEVDTEGFVLKDIPFCFEAGTPPIAESIAMGAAINFLTALGMNDVVDHEKQLTEYMLSKLSNIPEINIVGTTDIKIGTVSFYVDKVNSTDIAQMLNTFGIAVRSGFHCAQPLHKFLEVPATCRASLGVYNDEKDVDIFIDKLKDVIKVLTK